MKSLQIINIKYFLSLLVLMATLDIMPMILNEISCVKYDHYWIICFQNFKVFAQLNNSRPGVFCKKGVLKNFTKFTGKYLCQSLFFNKVACLRPATLLKKRLWHRCFPVNFVKFSRTPFSIEHVRWLLLTPKKCC